MSEKIALVTEGTGDLGLAISKALVSDGYKVIAAGLPGADLEAFNIDGASVRRMNVTNPFEIDEVFSGISYIDVLVNCAGAIKRDGAEFNIDNFIHVLDVNLNGTMRVCLAAYPLMKAKGGVIVNIASMHSLNGHEFVPAYSASCGGVIQLTKSLAAAWAKDGIRVNALAPGWIENNGINLEIPANTPIEEWGSKDDILDAVVFLCSSKAKSMTGMVNPLDDGEHAV